MEYQLNQIIQGGETCVPTVIAEIANWHLRNTNKKVDDKQLYREVCPNGGTISTDRVLNYGKSRGLPLQDSSRVFIQDFRAYSLSYAYAKQALDKSPCVLTMRMPCGASLATQTAQPPYKLHTFIIPHCVALIGYDDKKKEFKCVNSQTDANSGVFYFDYMWLMTQGIDLYTFTLKP